jgi:hypothetical protein
MRPSPRESSEDAVTGDSVNRIPAAGPAPCEWGGSEGGRARRSARCDRQWCRGAAQSSSRLATAVAFVAWSPTQSYPGGRRRSQATRPHGRIARGRSAPLPDNSEPSVRGSQRARGAAPQGRPGPGRRFSLLPVTTDGPGPGVARQPTSCALSLRLPWQDEIPKQAGRHPPPKLWLLCDQHACVIRPQADNAGDNRPATARQASECASVG